MSGWLACYFEFSGRKSSLASFRRLKIAYVSILVGYYAIFSFQNIYAKITRYKQVTYYCLTYAENIAMLVTWYCYTPSKDEWYHDVIIVLVPVVMLLQIVLQLIYYKCFHKKMHTKSPINSCGHVYLTELLYGKVDDEKDIYREEGNKFKYFRRPF